MFDLENCGISENLRTKKSRILCCNFEDRHSLTKRILTNFNLQLQNKQKVELRVDQYLTFTRLADTSIEKVDPNNTCLFSGNPTLDFCTTDPMLYKLSLRNDLRKNSNTEIMPKHIKHMQILRRQNKNSQRPNTTEDTIHTLHQCWRY